MTLRPSTLATLEQLKEADWFARVGQNLIDSGSITVPITIVSSWREAIQHCQDKEWEWLLNESANIYRERLAKVAKNEFNTWNEHIRAVKEFSVPLVKAKLDLVQKEHNLPPKVESTIRWIVTMTLTEAEYAHITEPGYLSKLSFWIVNGHFPCDWKGEFPNGNLVIY